MNKQIFTVLAVVFLIGLPGCYTQLVVRESRPVRTGPPDYSETYTDSSGTVVNDNYYYDEYPRTSSYFSYYYPVRNSYMWPTYYDPFYDWCYSPWVMYPSYYSPWYANPFYWGGYYGYMSYPYYHGYRYWDRYPLYTYSSNSRVRTFGVTRSPDSRVRDYGVSRGGFTGGTGSQSATRSRTDDAIDRISTRTRDRSTTIPQGNYTPPAGSRSRDNSGSTPTSVDRSRTRDNNGGSSTPTNVDRSRTRDNGSSATPQSDTRSRDRSSGGSSYSPPPRSSSPPPSSGGSSSGGSSSGGSRSRGSDGGSSSGGRTRGR